MPNRWSMYVQIDGHDVGDPDPNLRRGERRGSDDVQRAVQSGRHDRSVGPDEVLISNWVRST